VRLERFTREDLDLHMGLAAGDIAVSVGACYPYEALYES
jgi:hypothetical protein